MLSIHAYYTENKVFIDIKNEYAVGEILTAHLNTDYYNVLKEKDYINRLRDLCESLMIYDDMSYNHIVNYNSTVYEAIKIFGQINEWIYILPPYNKSLHKPMPELECFLNNYEMLFEQPNKGVSTLNYETYHLTKFIPKKTENCEAYYRELLIQFEQEIQKLFNIYIDFLESYVAVFEIFKPFIDKYLHYKETFLSSMNGQSNRSVLLF